MASQPVASVVGTGVGLTSTALIKHQFDAATETTLLRPSVLWGVGTGAVAYFAPMLLDWRQGTMKRALLEDYGEGAIVAGIFSALTTGGLTTPTL